MKKIIISGASGRVGKALLNVLKETDYEVFAMTSNLEKLSRYNEGNIRPILNDDFFKLEENFEDSIFLNLAFPTRNDVELINSALEFTRNMYQKLYDLGSRYFVNISSQSVYDRDRIKEATEETYPIPFNLYGYAKIYFERFTESYCLDRNINYVNLRLASVVGPNTDVRLNNKLIKAYLNDEDIEITLDKQIYSYIDICDVALALKAIFDEYDKIEWNTNYNLGTRYKYSAKDIYESVEKLVNHEYKGKLSFVEGDLQKTNQVNVDKLYSKITWRPIYDVDKTNKTILEEEHKIEARI